MRVIRFLLCTLFLTVSAASFAVPRILIVQVRGDAKETSDLPLGDALAQALMEEGKSDPIVWSQTDPVFRDAVLDGRVPVSEKPTPEEVQKAEKALKCDYVMVARVQIQGTLVAGRVDMYRGTKPVWNNIEAVDPHRSRENDLDNAIRSIARTWAIRVSAGPLKSIKAEPRPPQGPAPSQGQIPKTSATDPIPRVTDSTKAIEDYERLMAAKQVSEATNLLRQAIDTSPLDVKLRVQFIKHLKSIGRGRDAAEEARRAASLIPDNVELRAIAAQAYIDSGQGDQAEGQLNEALARNPNDTATRTMLADIALRGLKTPAASDHLDAAMKVAPTKDLAYRRVLCDAILGDPTAVQKGLAQLSQIPSWTGTPEDTYRLCMNVLGQAMEQSVGELRSLNQRAAVRPEDTQVAKAINDQITALHARQMLVDTWKPPTAHQKSQGILSLALKLLSQSLSELKAFLADGNKDTLTDASIDLGEAIKQLSAARSALATEGSVARDGSTTVYSYY